MGILILFQPTNFIYSISLECHDCNKILFHWKTASTTSFWTFSMTKWKLDRICIAVWQLLWAQQLQKTEQKMGQSIPTSGQHQFCAWQWHSNRKFPKTYSIDILNFFPSMKAASWHDPNLTSIGSMLPQLGCSLYPKQLMQALLNWFISWHQPEV